MIPNVSMYRVTRVSLLVISTYNTHWTSRRYFRFSHISMEIKDPEVASLSNCEVLSLLNQLKEKSQSTKSGNQFATILYETSQYLQNLHRDQSEDDVRKLLKALLDFQIPLTFKEKLMIVNTPPRTALELSLIIRNYDERLSDEQVDELLALISKFVK